MRFFWSVGVAALCLSACSWGSKPAPPVDSGRTPEPARAPELTVEKPTKGPSNPEPPPPPEEVFQPAFHQALRWSHTVESPTTFRMMVPMGRAGDRLRVVLRSGDGPLTISRASVMKSSGEPVALTFQGSPSVSLGAREAATSDALELPVTFGEELFVSFEAEGALAASAIEAFPGSEVREGKHAMSSALGGTEWNRGIGVTTIEVEAPKTAAFVVIGDSITEGYVSGRDDHRRAWPFIAQQEMKLPFANAGVSGQGLERAVQNVAVDALALSNLTDCILLIGTNDLQTREVSWIVTHMESLIAALKPHCRVWAGTLLPKERVSEGELPVAQARRVEVNTWLRDQAAIEGKLAGLIDFEAFTRSPTSVHEFIEGYGHDGIHPSVEGQRVMGMEAARFLSGQDLAR